jgi:formate hydrogenlyase subunit 3/multisubunit Na+/H+ antiporter MnhD subunit
MSTLRLTVGLLTIAALLALVYYTSLELSAVWRAMATLSYQPLTAVTEQNAYRLLVFSIVFSVLMMLLLIAIIAVLHFARRLS